MSETFDLHAALTGRSYPETVVSIWLDEEPWYQLEALEKKHASMKKTAPEFKETEERIKALQESIGEQAYKVHLRGISPRAGEDIISLALSELPIKRDQYGLEDELQKIRRNRVISELSFAAHIQKIVDPAGREVIFEKETARDKARTFLGEAPPSAIQTVDNGIAAVSRKFVEQQARHTSPDFS